MLVPGNLCDIYSPLGSLMAERSTVKWELSETFRGAGEGTLQLGPHPLRHIQFNFISECNSSFCILKDMMLQTFSSVLMAPQKGITKPASNASCVPSTMFGTRKSPFVTITVSNNGVETPK